MHQPWVCGSFMGHIQLTHGAHDKADACPWECGSFMGHIQLTHDAHDKADACALGVRFFFGAHSVNPWCT